MDTAVFQPQNLIKHQQHLYQELLTAQSPEEVARVALNPLEQMIPTADIAVLIMDSGLDDSLTFITRSHSPIHLPGGQATLINQLREGQVVLLEEADLSDSDNGYILLQSIFADGIRSLTAVPMWTEEAFVGALLLGSLEPDGFDLESTTVATTLATPIAIAIQQARLKAAARRQTTLLEKREHFLERLALITNEVAGIVNLQEMLQTVADNLTSLCAADGCLITTINRESNQLETLAGTDSLAAGIEGRPPLPAANSLTHFVLQEERVVYIEDISESVEFDLEIELSLPVTSVLGIPFITGSRKFGAAIVFYVDLHTFTPEEITQLKRAATPLSLAIIKSRLLAQEREQREMAEALREAGTALNATLEFDSVLDQILIQIARVVPYDSANIMMIEDGRAQIVRHRGYDQYRPDLFSKLDDFHYVIADTPNLKNIIESKQPGFIPDMSHYQSWVGEPGHVRSWAGAPILITDLVVAIICVDKIEPNFYQTEHISRLSLFANQVAMAMQNARLHKATQRQLEELFVLQALATASVEAMDEDTLIDQATQLIGDTLYPHNFGILLYDDSQNQLQVHPSYRLKNKQLQESNLPAEQGIVGHVLTSQAAYRTHDTVTDPYYTEVDPGTRSEICVPLFQANQIIGVINAESKELHAFSDGDEYLLMTLARQLGIAIEKLRLFLETQRQARDLRIISRILRVLNATPDVATAFPDLGAEIIQLVQCDAVNIILLNPYKRISKIITQAETDFLAVYSHKLQLSDSAAGTALLTNEIFIIPDLSEHEDFALESLLSRAGYRSSINMAIAIGDNLAGFINFLWKTTPENQDAHHFRYHQLASAITLAMERSHHFEEIKQWAQQLTFLHELSHEITGLIEVEEICRICVYQLQHKLNYLSVSIFFVDETAQKLTLASLCGPNKELILAGEYQQDFDQGIIGLAAKTQQSVITNDAEAHPHFLESNRMRVRSELAMPLRHGQHLIGILSVSSDIRDAFTDNDVAILTIASDQIAAALERGRLFEQTIGHAATLEQRNQELMALNEVGQSLVANLDRTVIYETIYKKIIQPILDIPHFTVALYNRAEQTIICDYAVTDGEPTDISAFPPIPYGKGIISDTIKARQARIINLEVALPPLAANGRTVQIGDERRPRSGLYVPLISGETIIGVLYVQDYRQDAFTESDVTLLSMLASQVSAAIEKTRLFEETQERAAKLEALTSLSTELRIAQSIEEMMLPILQRAMHVVGGSTGRLYLKDLESDSFIVRGVAPSNPGMLDSRIQADTGIFGRIVTSGEMLSIATSDMSNLNEFQPEDQAWLVQEALQCGIGLPLRVQNRIIGVLCVFLSHEHIFTEEEKGFLNAISEIAGGALDRMMLLQTLEIRVDVRTRELANANERLKELDRLKSKFISDVSHELRTPITNLGLYLDLFVHSPSEKHPHYLSILRKQTDRLTRLIQDILNLSRVELGGAKVQFSPVSINDIVTSVAVAHRLQVEEKELSLIQEYDEEIPLIHGERNQLAQVVTHLIDNAIRYTNEGHILVCTGFDNEGSRVFFQVSDTGMGLSAADIPHLFDRFYRGRHASQSNIPGTGLGLAIVKEVVDLHGGTIEARGQEDGGASFTVWLPYYEAE